MDKIGIIADLITIFLFIIKIVIGIYRTVRKLHELHIKKRPKK